MIRLGDQHTFLEPFHVAVSLGGAFVSGVVPRPGCGEVERRLALATALLGFEGVGPAMGRVPAKRARSTRAAGRPRPRRRWVVERTFAWFGRNRRLAKDFEKTIESAEAWLLIASIQLLTRRIARP